MCKCTPNKRTPWCGAPGCEAPPQVKADRVFLRLRAGTIRRLYLDKKAAARKQPPIVVEEGEKKWLCRDVQFQVADWNGATGFVRMRWNAEPVAPPISWVETDCELELLL